MWNLLLKERISGLECPGDKGEKSARLVLKGSNPLKVFDYVLILFSMTEHHCSRGLKSNLVGFSRNLNPPIGIDFERTYPLSNPIAQNLSAASGDCPQPRLPEFFQHLFRANPRIPRYCADFRGGKRVEMKIGNLFSYTPYKFYVVVKPNFRVVAALKENSGRTIVKRRLQDGIFSLPSLPEIRVQTSLPCEEGEGHLQRLSVPWYGFYCGFHQLSFPILFNPIIITVSIYVDLTSEVGAGSKPAPTSSGD